MLLQAVKKWQNLYPDASIFVTGFKFLSKSLLPFIYLLGDFNTANGHEPHRILVSNNNILKDVWDECVSSEECLNHDFSSSFHGWIGSHVNKYGARIIHFILQIIHGSGADLPRSVKYTFILICTYNDI